MSDEDEAGAASAERVSGTNPVSRRRLFAYTGAVGAGSLSLGAAAGAFAAPGGASSPGGSTAGLLREAAAGDERLPFYGTHQSGIEAPAQAQGWLVVFDLKAGATAARVRGLMAQWAQIGAAAAAGRPLPSGDDAMAYGRGPGSVSVAVGFGASLLTKIGLGHRIPPELAPLPDFLNDELDPAASDGDLAVFVAANDGLVAVHALRAMQRAAAALCTQRWQVSGFADGAGVMPSPTSTPRNLMGQLDGTGNPRPGTDAFERTVYVPADGSPGWMRGGSYLVFRRIRMLLDDWDTLGRAAQEAVIGREKESGAPLSGGAEFTAPDYRKFTAAGALVIPPGAHIRQASSQSNSGATILRRAFNYYNGPRSDGAPDAGLLFLAFQANPATGFIPIQQRVSGADSLSTFIRHEASALFAIPPGSAQGGYPGQELLEGA